MERTPKQRIIFDDLAEDYEIDKDELDVSFDEYVAHRRDEEVLYDIKYWDFTEEMSSLRNFLDNGNPLIVYGSIGRWEGTRTGFTVYENFDAVIDISPSRFGGDNVFADCEIQKVWDENGHLFIHGAHHDGSVTVELRQLTDAGANAYEAISEKTYDGSEQSVMQAMHDLWKEPGFCQLPHYMEKEFGCPSEEWQLEPRPMERIGFEDEERISLKTEAKQARAASDKLADERGGGRWHGKTRPSCRYRKSAKTWSKMHTKSGFPRFQ